MDLPTREPAGEVTPLAGAETARASGSQGAARESISGRGWMITDTSPGTRSKTASSSARKASRSSSTRSAAAAWVDSWRATNERLAVSTQGTTTNLGDRARAR